MGTPEQTRAESTSELKINSQPRSAPCTPNRSPQQPPSFCSSVWWRQDLDYNATNVTATTAITAGTHSTTLTHLASLRPTNSRNLALTTVTRTPSAGRSTRKCVET